MKESLSRKDVLINLLALPLGAGIAAATAGTAIAADSKSPQSAVQYQNKPKGAAKCSGCKFYIPNKAKKTANGGCQVVSGSISPNGWCVVYAKKA